MFLNREIRVFKKTEIADLMRIVEIDKNRYLFAGLRLKDGAEEAC
jgi:hypothetical protein